MDAAQSFKAWKRQFIKDYGFKLIQFIERLIERYSLVGNAAFFDPKWFP